MTNFLKMAQAIADLGYDVYIFKRFADGYRDDFVYQLSKIKTIFIVSPLTGRVYTCSQNCFLFEESEFLFGAVEYEPTMKRAEYGWEGYGYCCQENGTLDTAGLKDFFEEIFLIWKQSTTKVKQVLLFIQQNLLRNGTLLS